MKVAIGQDSHRFDFDDKEKQLILGGVVIPGESPLSGNSDADVILHSLTNAISGITGVNILGKVSDDLCEARNNGQQSLFTRSIEIFKRRHYSCVAIYRVQDP